MPSSKAPRLKAAYTADGKIIVGIDYGTTFTGASYSIDSWPGNARGIDTVSKSPSRIAYAAENPRASRNLWGYQISSNMSAYAWTKLLLDNNTKLTEYDDPALEATLGTGILRLPAGKSAVDVAADYLTLVYQHIRHTLVRHITEEALKKTPLEFWFTVPAIWSDQAKHATRTAAQRAGFWSSPERPHDRLYFISEPEAAAITALRRYTSDSTGGSITKVAPTLKFKELLTGVGGKCGSTSIDRNFHKFMSHRFGDAFDRLPMSTKGPGSAFMDKFEIIKKDFGSSTSYDIFALPLNMKLPHTTSPEYFDVEERLVQLTSDDMRTFFDPVVDKIINLLQGQIAEARKLRGKKPINRIILVGGFGGSEYLCRRVRSTFGTTGKITVTIPPNPQTAIVQGAALRGLEGIRSTTKLCRRHYGFECAIDFREGLDDERNAWIDPFNDRKLVRGIMKWMISKGEKYAEEYKQTVYTRWTHRKCDSLIKSTNSYASEKMLAPERMDADGVYKVGCIVVDFTEVDLSQFPVVRKGGQRIYNLQYNIRVTFGAQDGLLKFEATCQGKIIGKTSIEFTAT
ncbi:hypothetical protein ASPACDRAFT_1890175 [Aspergillus aculeatus ATCC 16872]|uniref:Uncharacterized protein n=1 Tax=Aspergillus aculeatus (strain ATCC 16872 / CBS 172.66 / WB 5094) TaxID=690307 RepID=A0A1L9WN08_ASPA1|nr:uncharacterized protein ASPACDRAFT_1890175 [Aspergillus aculeatus ATCC 16872]OJJ97569.1 hypothetical protein ASPACDRAFT_1890175 [Aspergillus aculeatus ATCC 16872]